MLEDTPAVLEIDQAFQDFLELAPDAMIVVDGSGRIIMCNSQTDRLFGFQRDELLGRNVDMLVPKRLQAQHAVHRTGYIEDPRSRPMGAGLELFGLRKDGSEFPVEISLSPIKTKNSLVISSAIRNISERKRIEQALQEKNLELERANFAKDRFLASMSHELRTPLNAIIGFTGTMLMKLPGPLTAEQERQLKTVQSSARHLLSLINDVLDIAKIESGKVEMSFEPVAVNDIARDVLTSLRSFADGKGLSMDLVESDTAIVIKSDQRALYQIVSNLVNNAIKYTQAGWVRIEVARISGGRYDAAVIVSDSGIGIKPEDHARLFQLFEQLGPLGSHSLEGLGLGLYLCKRLSVLIGARLRVASEPGKGSTFTLELPDEP